MTLTDTQRDILRRMATGEELRQSHSFTSYAGRWWLANKKINGNTANGLLKRELIVAQPYRYGSFETVYRLTDAGREAAKGE